MTTISGTAVPSPAGTTLQNLIDRTQQTLADTTAATWSETALGQWLNDAMRDYSIHFPRQRTATIATVVGDRTYDLPADVVGVISVEYPTDADPPVYLERKSYTEAGFWSDDGFYDVVRRGDDQNAAELWISKKPAAGETITVEYLAAHDHGLTVSEYVTVPDEHHHVLVAYAVWQSALNLQMAEQQSPTSNSSLLMSQHAQNANVLRRQYVELLARIAQAHSGSDGGFVSWDREWVY